MNYRLFWIKNTQAELTNAWLEAKDRNRLTIATNRIEEFLARDPLGVGESRHGQERILILPPLQVLYEIDQQNKRVFITQVKLFGKHG